MISTLAEFLPPMQTGLGHTFKLAGRVFCQLYLRLRHRLVNADSLLLNIGKKRKGNHHNNSRSR